MINDDMSNYDEEGIYMIMNEEHPFRMAALKQIFFFFFLGGGGCLPYLFSKMRT